MCTDGARSLGGDRRGHIPDRGRRGDEGVVPHEHRGVNLNGYQFVSSYPLGFDKGNTFKQTYSTTTASYATEKGPFFGTNGSGIPYIALPIAHRIFMVVWLLPDGTHNSLVYNLNNGIISVVTNGKTGTPSLGTVKLVKTGTHPLP
jgi:hypothetical protein